MKALWMLALAAAAAALVWAWRVRVGPALARRVRGEATVASRLEESGAAADARWRPHFERAGVAYPPDRVALAGLKEERRLEVYAAGADGAWRFVRAFPVLAASGRAGPKLREGDRQVPEGCYRVASLNPNSRFHLALRLD